MLYLGSYWSKTSTDIAPTFPLERLFYGPLWPLPVFIGVAGTGKGLTSGLLHNTYTSEYAEAVALAILVSAPSTNLGNVYLVQSVNGGFSKNNNGSVVLSVAPGESLSLPVSEYSGNRYLASAYGIDWDFTGSLAYVCLVMQ